MKQSIIFFVSILLLLSCKKDVTEINQSIDNTKWKLIGIINNETNEEITSPDEINITISFLDSGVSSLAICNTGIGQFSSTSDSISISCAFTKIWCGISSKYPIIWDEIYIRNLNRAKKYKIDTNKFLLYTEGDFNLKFEKIKD